MIILCSYTSPLTTITYRLYALLAFKFGVSENLRRMVEIVAGSLDSASYNSPSNDDNFCQAIQHVSKELEVS